MELGIKKSVAILLSVYNGGHFLEAQLKSLISQRYDDWILVWRDDGSSDESRTIMRSFSDNVGAGRCLELQDDRGRLGAAASFHRLLQWTQSYPFVAFCDQDDVWLPNKLTRAMDRVTAIDQTVPILYCSRQMIVDKSLAFQRLSSIPGKVREFPSSLLRNIATGCTVVLNRSAARLVAGSSPASAFVHDWWSYIVVSAVNGHIIYDETPMILYRQHGTNTIGATPSVLVRMKAALGRGLGYYLALLYDQSSALLSSGLPLSVDTCEILYNIRTAIEGGRFCRLKLFCNRSFRRDSWWENALLALWMVAGSARKNTVMLGVTSGSQSPKNRS